MINAKKLLHETPYRYFMYTIKCFSILRSILSSVITPIAGLCLIFSYRQLSKFSEMRLTKSEQACESWYRLVVNFVPLHICNVHRLAYLVKGSLCFATEYAVLMRLHTASCISSAFLLMLADTDGIRFD